MAKTPEMTYTVKNNQIEVKLPLTSQGKFRCKKRTNFQDFGNGFAPKSTIITDNAYLEWQIGYDTIRGKDEKPSKLNTNDFIFVGANKKSKYPYELSEIMFYMCKMGFYSKDDLTALILNIKSMNEFMSEKYQIEVKKEEPVTLNNEKFFTSSTKLPTFITQVHQSGIMIEIMIQKQQYATGVQPMLYLIIPMKSFHNSNEIINHTSSETPYGILNFNETYKEIISELFICFGMCSQAHSHDVIEILKVIQKNVFN